MNRHLASLACLALCALPTPALAAHDHPVTEPPPLRSPALAAGLAVVAPTALIFLSSQSTDFIVNFSVPVLGLGAGHLYAGDPLRGALVTVGSTAVGLGTFALLHRSGGNGGGGAYAVGMFSVGLAVGLAAADAYWTTEQKNREALSTLR